MRRVWQPTRRCHVANSRSTARRNGVAPWNPARQSAVHGAQKLAGADAMSAYHLQDRRARRRLGLQARRCLLRDVSHPRRAVKPRMVAASSACPAARRRSSTRTRTANGTRSSRGATTGRGDVMEYLNRRAAGISSRARVGERRRGPTFPRACPVSPRHRAGISRSRSVIRVEFDPARGYVAFPLRAIARSRQFPFAPASAPRTA